MGAGLGNVGSLTLCFGRTSLGSLGSVWLSFGSVLGNLEGVLWECACLSLSLERGPEGAAQVVICEEVVCTQGSCAVRTIEHAQL